MKIKAVDKCPRCKGVGDIDHPEMVQIECPRCKGTGEYERTIPLVDLARLITEEQAREGAGS